MPAPVVPVIRINLDFQIEIVPADGIRLPMGEAETSVGRRFWAALSQVIRLTARQRTTLVS
jgi:hypothetical protein